MRPLACSHHNRATLARSIITVALGVGGTLLGLVPFATRGEVSASRLERNIAQKKMASARSHSILTKLPCPRLQRKRMIFDRWTEALYDRDAAIKGQFK